MKPCVWVQAWQSLDLGLHPPIDALRIYSYKPADSPALAALLSCDSSVDSPEHRLERQLITAFAASGATTQDAYQADFFFVPAAPACLSSAGVGDDEVSKLYKRAVESLPHFQVSGGRNHIFAFTTQSWSLRFPRLVRSCLKRYCADEM